jgi:hypothetical protein
LCLDIPVIKNIVPMDKNGKEIDQKYIRELSGGFNNNKLELISIS